MDEIEIKVLVSDRKIEELINEVKLLRAEFNAKSGNDFKEYLSRKDVMKIMDWSYKQFWIRVNDKENPLPIKKDGNNCWIKRADFAKWRDSTFLEREKKCDKK